MFDPVLSQSSLSLVSSAMSGSLVLVYGLVFMMGLASKFFKSRDRLSHIPTVGPSAPVLSYIGAFKYLFSAQKMIRDGYTMYNGRPFKVAQMRRWLVVIGEPRLVEELYKAPDDMLSQPEAVKEFLQIKYTLGLSIIDNPYQVRVIRVNLTRNLPAIFPDVRDEIVAAFNHVVSPKGDEWVALSARDTVMSIVFRVINRVLIGLPLCRNEDWLNNNLDFANDVFKVASVIAFFPAFLQPFVGKLTTSPQKAMARAMSFLEPIIQERQKLIDEYGKDYPNKPNDLLTWLMDDAKGESRSVQEYTRRIMSTNFAALHTTAAIFTHTLYNLAADPDRYMKPLREEAEAVIHEEGWTKAAMQKMRKIDSFIKESARLDGLGSLASKRLAVRPFTFSDGTYVPAGSLLAACSDGLHRDSSYYPNGEEFDAFRFAHMQKGEGGIEPRHSLVSASPDWLLFGHGKHSCAARHFVTAELSAMLAHLVITYDIKLEHEGVRPPNHQFGDISIPNESAKVRFRRRQDIEAFRKKF